MNARTHTSSRRRRDSATSWRAAAAVIASTVAVALLPPVVPPASAQPYGQWSLGAGAFGDRHWRPPVADAASLPSTDPDGTVRLVLSEVAPYCRSGAAWSACGGSGGSGLPGARVRTLDCDGGGDYTTLSEALAALAAIPLAAGQRSPQDQWVLVAAPCVYTEPTGLVVPRWVTVTCAATTPDLDSTWGDIQPCQVIAGDGTGDLLRLGDSSLVGGWYLQQPNVLVGGPHALVAHEPTGGFVAIQDVSLHAWVASAVGLRMDSPFSDRLLLDNVRITQEGWLGTKGIVYSSAGPGWIHGGAITTAGVGGDVAIQNTGAGDLEVIGTSIESAWTTQLVRSGSGELLVDAPWTTSSGTITPWLPPHATTHATGGTDPVTITEAQVSDLAHTVDTDDQAAGEVPYAPTAPGDWTDPDPAEVAAALDDLAARPAGATPAGTGSELQYRAGAATFGAVPGSSVSAGDVTLDGGIVLADFADSGGVAIGFSADAGTGIWRQAGTGLQLRSGGADRVTVTANGARIDYMLRLVPQASAPGSCGVGDVYADTSGALCFCAALNSWEQLNATGACS